MLKIKRKMNYAGHIKRYERLEKGIMERYIPERRKSGRPKMRWVQDITDDLQMSASNADQLAYDRASPEGLSMKQS
jgi:hypothetical protein